MMKRIVGLPLEKMEIRHKVLYVNSKPLSEPYVVHSDPTDNTGASKEPYKSRDTLGPITLAFNEYFILGDNRDSSNDSRYHGPVRRSALVGKVTLGMTRFRGQVDIRSGDDRLTPLELNG